MAEIAASLSLDSYAAYVWAAYGVTGLGVALMVVACWIERRRVQRRLAAEASAARPRNETSTEAP